MVPPAAPAEGEVRGSQPEPGVGPEAVEAVAQPVQVAVVQPVAKEGAVPRHFQMFSSQTLFTHLANELIKQSPTPALWIIIIARG
jgi:hypothetical protein